MTTEARSCRAFQCEEPLGPDWQVMCGRHWGMVSTPLRRLLAHHRDTDPKAYEKTLTRAVNQVERAEFGERLL